MHYPCTYLRITGIFPALLLSIYLVSCTLQPPSPTPNTHTTSLSMPTEQQKQLSIQSAQSHFTSKSMSEVTLSKVNNGQVVTLKRGQILIVHLDENPTTGYRWSKPTLNTQVLQLKSDKFNLSNNTGIGSGGQHVFTFQANNSGQVKLQLKNWREWAGDQSNIEQFEVTVQVIE
jgi:inhibitor of cysteine peptidase